MDDADETGCTDIDDALHARPLPNGNIEAGVRKSILPLQRALPMTRHCRRIQLCSSR